MATPTPRPILVPIDFSDNCKAALRHAARLAEPFDQPLLILHVVHETADQAGYYRSRDTSGRTLPLYDIAEQLLERFVDELRAEQGISQSLATAGTLVVCGLPANRILEVAEARDAGMIVMGTHGRQGLARLLLGSVAQHIAQHSRIPVTTIRVQDAIEGAALAPAWQVAS